MSDSELERDDFDRDDELRALLRGGDPAGALPSADPAALVHLLEDIMSADLEIRPAQPDAGDEGSRATVLLTNKFPAGTDELVADSRLLNKIRIEATPPKK